MLPFIPCSVKHTSPLNLPLEFSALEGRKHVSLIFLSLRVSGVVHAERGPKECLLRHLNTVSAGVLIISETGSLHFYNDVLFVFFFILT